MKLTRVKKVLLILILLIASFLIGNKVQAAAINLRDFNDCYTEGDGYASEPHSWGCTPSDSECSQPGYLMDRYLGTGKAYDGVLYFNTTSSSDLKHFFGYAKYLGADIEVMQHVVWASAYYRGYGENFNDNPTYGDYRDGVPRKTHYYASHPIVVHANDYAKTYYNLISKGEIFKDYTDENKLRLYVNQSNRKYISGPYKIGLKYTDTTSVEAAKLLYKEIVDRKKEDKAFAWTLEPEGINGTDCEYLDKDGNVIKFPDFVSGQEFYIRFTPKNAGAIIEVGKPIIKFGYFNWFYGNWTHWVDTGISFRARYCGPHAEYVVDEPAHWSEPDEEGNREWIRATYKLIGYSYSPPVGIGKIFYSKDSTLPSPDAWLNFGSNAQNMINAIRVDVAEEKESKFTIKHSTKVNMEIGGNVWLDGGENKTGKVNGRNGDAEDVRLGGIEVRLYDSNKSLIATTTTDKNGQYRFYGAMGGRPLINPLKKYFVQFSYDGQRYQSTYYQNNLRYQNPYLSTSMTSAQLKMTSGASNAKDQNREDYNNRFATIYSEGDNYNYNGWHKSYALKQKIEKDDGSFIAYKDGALTYEDVYDKFLELATFESDTPEPSKEDYKVGWGRSKSYEQVLNGTFSSWLSSVGASANERSSIIQFIKDTLMTASTYNGSDLRQLYPVYNQFVPEVFNVAPTYVTIGGKRLTNRNDERDDDLDSTYTYLYLPVSDQARCVDFGIANRNTNDLAIQKDVYKATVLVNGKKQEYTYNKKDVDNEGSWEVEARAGDALYNGQEVYERKIRKSEYLYDGSDSGTTDDKNMQIYITYRIAVKNQGEMNVRLDEIVDYYDADTYEFDGNLSGDTYTAKSYRYSPLEEKQDGQSGSTYVNSYVGSNKKGRMMQNLTVKTTGIPNSRAQETLTGANYNYSTLYLTGLKSTSGDDILERGEFAFAYITFKVKTDNSTDKVMLDQDLRTGAVTAGKKNIAEINAYSSFYPSGSTIPGNAGQNIDVSGKVSGIIDTDSNPGSLKTKDLNDNGDIITSTNPVEDRQQDDTDKAPNIRIIINPNDEDTRRLKGYIYEDERNTVSNKAVVGDGVDNGETKINGVTLQLVEIVQDVDEDGIFTGNYIGEKVWASYNYNGLDTNRLNNASKNYSRYYSGQGTSKIVINGPSGTILYVNNDSLGQGEYSFKSVPAGNFYIRYIYGDTVQTVLTSNADNEVNKLIGQTGLNLKSYNGQDYKTTVYQSGVSQNSSYNGIRGYTDYENQNYYQINNLNVNSSNDNVLAEPSVDTSKMYFYDIDNAGARSGVSDGKDVYYYRERTNNWSKGANGTSLLNNRAEILASFEKVATANDANQIDMLNTLMQNTFMVAQTGIINAEIEYNREKTDYQSENLRYTVDDIDLGLVERPKAQLRINKEIENFTLALANGQVLFDTDKSVNNLYFSEHKTHDVNYNSLGAIREVIVNKNSRSETPELLQVYIDNELLVGATIDIRYKFKVDNVGEVDYMDKQFYYSGRTNNASASNIAKTNPLQIVDYVSNEVRFENKNQESEWIVRTPAQLTTSKSGGNIENDLVNRRYINQLETYNTLITTSEFSESLVPNINNSGNSSKEAKLMVSTQIAGNKSLENLVYNNLCEIIEMSNEVGRRCTYSIVGNQEMADQSLGNDAPADEYSRADRVLPEEIDADSAQRVVLMPPTGEEQNLMLIVMGITIFVGIAVCGVLVIKKLI